MADTYQLVVERKLEHPTHGGFVSLLPDESTLLVGDGWGTAYASMCLRRLDVETLREAAKAKTRDGVRCVARWDERRALLACTYKRLLVLDMETFAIKARVERIGEGLDAVAADRKGDHVLLGSTWKDQVKVLGTKDWSLEARKRVGRTWGVLGTEAGHTFFHLDGPAGRVRVFDANLRRVLQEAVVPPFGRVGVYASRLFLATGRVEPHAFMPAVKVHIEPPSAPEQAAKVSVRSSSEPPKVAMPGSEAVQRPDGVALFDVNRLELERVIPVPTFRWLQVCDRGESIVLATDDQVVSIHVPEGHQEWQWRVPPGIIPRAALLGGRRLIVTRDPAVVEVSGTDWIAVIEPVR